MPTIDRPLPELQRYESAVNVPSDFADFWDATLTEARRAAVSPLVIEADNALSLVQSFDLTFSGFAGQLIRGWLHVPRGAEDPLPTVIQFHGYAGGRGFAHQGQLYALAGYAHLIMDVRGQGWLMQGDTPDLHTVPANSSVPGFLTRGILTPHDYYYRRLLTDAARLVEVAATFDIVDEAQIVVTGGSQGAAQAIAAAALNPTTAGVMLDVPFLSDVPRAVELSPSDPYLELARFFAQYPDQEPAAWRTLAYFDAVNFARQTSAPALFSVALLDQVTPPSTGYAAFHAYRGDDKQMVVYPYCGHEGGGALHERRKLDWLATLFTPGSSPRGD